MRTEQFLPILVIGGGIIIGYFAMLCGVNPECRFAEFAHEYSFTISKPLWIFSLFSIPAVILLPIVKKRVFSSWLRFAAVWLLLSVLVIAWTPEASYSWFQIVSFVKEDAARLMGILFSGLSLLLLAWQTYMPKHVRNAHL